jgi:hypothetical protein
MSTRVLVDTNAIFPAVKVGEWNRLCGYYQVETVAAVVAETQNGNVNRPGYVPVDESMLIKTLHKIHEVCTHDRAVFQLKLLERRIVLDPGELDLLAHVYSHEKVTSNLLILTMADRAAVRTCCAFGWEDNLVSLEKLLEDAGSPRAATRRLEYHHGEKWLSSVRTDFRMQLLR